jgi:hypothetical protein
MTMPPRNYLDNVFVAALTGVCETAETASRVQAQPSKYIFRVRQLLELWETGAIPNANAVLHWIQHHTESDENKGA